VTATAALLKASPGKSTAIAVIVVFSALIAVGTILSIPLPPPLYELTWSPAIYLALSALVDSGTAFDATVIGSFLGEAFNVAFKGGGSPIYPFGIVWARGPEVLIVSWARGKGTRTLAAAMAAATVFETLAFLLSDWAFYSYGLFQYGSPTDAVTAFWAASPDLATLLDLAYIPVALLLVQRARPAFGRLGFE
jgi:hypothetical protein